MGACISGKKIFFLIDLFCAGHNNLRTLFKFRITEFRVDEEPILYREKYRMGPIPLTPSKTASHSPYNASYDLHNEDTSTISSQEYALPSDKLQ